MILLTSKNYIIYTYSEDFIKLIVIIIRWLDIIKKK